MGCYVCQMLWYYFYNVLHNTKLLNFWNFLFVGIFTLNSQRKIYRIFQGVIWPKIPSWTKRRAIFDVNMIQWHNMDRKRLLGLYYHHKIFWQISATSGNFTGIALWRIPYFCCLGTWILTIHFQGRHSQWPEVAEIFQKLFWW